MIDNQAPSILPKRSVRDVQVGDVFGLLTVTAEAPRRHRQRCFTVQCSCNSPVKVAYGINLTRGLTTSCGCHRSRVLSQRNQTHGLRHTTEYNTWAHIKARCNNPNDENYAKYGGRGIKVCDEWNNSFETFIKDMGERPSPEHVLHRIDGNDDYAPHNCQWTTTNHWRNITHGLSYSPEYNTWAGIKARCNNPNDEDYVKYGGRGIKVCDEWNESFETFNKDMGKKPSTDHSIDRIDGNEGYHPLNCRWADRTEQVHNQRGKQAQYHTISPGIFTTTKAILWYLTEICSDTRVISIFGTYRREYRDTNFFQYCKDTIPTFDEVTCLAYLKEHKGIYLIEDLKKVEV